MTPIDDRPWHLPEGAVCHACGVRPGEESPLAPRCATCGDWLIARAVHDSHAEDPMLGKLIADKYPLVDVLGSGGFGTVYRAKQIAADEAIREVAVKLLRPRPTEDPLHASERFFREARAIARLNHRNVVQLYDFGLRDDGVFYMVLELVNGRTLAAAMRQGETFDVERTGAIFEQVLEGMAVFHEAGLVHRDLKPENIMLVDTTREKDVVKLLDFGVAEVFDVEGDERSARSNVAYGTVCYLAPEQVVGAPLDGRADLYSIGIVLFELWAGHKPFEADQAMIVMFLHVYRDLPQLPASVPAGMVGLIYRSLQKRPHDRFSSADEMRAALQAVLAAPGEALVGAARPLALDRLRALERATALDEADEVDEVSEVDALACGSPGWRPPAIRGGSDDPRLDGVDVERLRKADLHDFIAYIDLSCPFCFALHERMDRWGLSEQIRWQLVRHASHVVTETLRVEDGDLADEVASAARQAPDVGVRLPSRRPDPALAHSVIVHAQRHDPAWGHRLTSTLYRALWHHGQDLSNSDILRTQLTDLDLPVSLLDQALRSQPDMLAAWQSDWENADYDLSIPVIAHPRSGRALIGLPSQRNLARFLLGDEERLTTSAVCHYQQRPLVVVSGWMDQLWEALADVRACCEVVHAPSVDRGLQALTGPIRPCNLIIQQEVFDEAELESLVATARSQEIPWAIATGEPSAEGEISALASGASTYLPLTEGGALARVRVGRMLAGCFELALLRSSRRTDSLTQLPNQRAFEGLFAEALDRATRDRSTLSLMRIDLDHFKAFNAAFGHLVSDDCLRTVARILDEGIRSAGGHLARHGGQEFVAVLANTPHDQAMSLAAKLRVAVAEAAIEHPRSPTSDHLTVSVGVCTAAPPLGGGLPDLLGAAGRALASAKRSGRDQVAAVDLGSSPGR